RRCVVEKLFQPVQEFSRQPEALMPGPAPGDLARDEMLPLRLEAQQFAGRDPLHFPDDLADLMQRALLLILEQPWPDLRTDDPRQARDDEVRPLIARSRLDDLRDRNAQPAMEPRQRSPLRFELMTEHRRKNLENELFVERDNKICAGRK